MITFFTNTKPFTGEFDNVQRNAIGSWTNAHPGCQVIVFGNAAGTKEAVEDLGVEAVPDAATNERGQPMLDFIFAEARRRARHDLVCYINADIITVHDVALEIRRIPFHHFMVVGQRWDLDVPGRIDFGEPEWADEKRSASFTHGRAHPRHGSDYFAFPRDLPFVMPPFVLGSIAWDNWVITHCLQRKIPLVDGSRSIHIVHQNHGGIASKDMPGRDENVKLAGGAAKLFTLDYAPWALTPSGVEAARPLPFRRHLATNMAKSYAGRLRRVFRDSGREA